ncbi:MAG: peptidylprolyl isomerase [Oscillospiraceae bacterium]|nr:peptidylprolyl isomerase [Oscillospiraceae bacterium]
MSASQEKKKRRELKVETPEAAKAKKKEKTNKKVKKTIITIVVIVVIIAVAFAIVWNSALFHVGVNAVKVGNWKFNATEYNYFYNTRLYSAYQNIYNTYGDYSYLLLDLNKSLDDQYYSDEQTWNDYLREGTLDRMQQLAMLNDAAAAEGWQLPDEAKQEIEDSVAQIKQGAASVGYPLKTYLASYYGKYLSEETFRDLLEKEVVAKYYAVDQLRRLSFTDEQLDAKYDEIAPTYNLITYYSYTVSGAADDENNIDEDTAMNRAYDTASAIAAANTEEAFAELVKRYAPEEEQSLYNDPDACRHENTPPTAFSGDEKDWLTDTARQYGDTTVIKGTSSYTVYLYVDRNENEYTMRTFRIILINADTDQDLGTVTADTIAAAKTEMDQIYSQWLEDPTEDNFASLASSKSEDTRSSSDGGLYSNVTMGYLDPSLDKWLFDDARVEGDTEIIYISDDSNTGYYLLYFVKEGERYDRSVARTALENDWAEQWRAENEAAYPVTTGFGFNFVRKK